MQKNQTIPVCVKYVGRSSSNGGTVATNGAKIPITVSLEWLDDGRPCPGGLRLRPKQQHPYSKGHSKNSQHQASLVGSSASEKLS